MLWSSRSTAALQVIASLQECFCCSLPSFFLGYLQPLRQRPLPPFLHLLPASLWPPVSKHISPVAVAAAPTVLTLNPEFRLSSLSSLRSRWILGAGRGHAYTKSMSQPAFFLLVVRIQRFSSQTRWRDSDLSWFEFDLVLSSNRLFWFWSLNDLQLIKGWSKVAAVTQRCSFSAEISLWTWCKHFLTTLQTFTRHWSQKKKGHSFKCHPFMI